MRRTLGETQARKILASLQDVATTKSRTFTNNWYDFYKEEVFTHAMIRSSEAYFAYRKGERILQGLQELDADARQPFSIELKGTGPQAQFDFQFDSKNFLRGRIAVIIGQNGCGKTSALAKLSKVLADKESRSAEITNRPELNQVIAFIHTASVRQFSPRQRRGSRELGFLHSIRQAPASKARTLQQHCLSMWLADMMLKVLCLNISRIFCALNSVSLKFWSQ